MAVPSQVQNLESQQADGNILLTWTGVSGALTYNIQRSLDGVNFTNLATSVAAQYIDSFPGVGIQYYYQVAGVNGDGTGIYSAITSMVAAPPGEMSLGELRLRSQQASDMVNSNFVSTTEWNAFIRLGLYELYDLLIDVYEDWGIAEPVYINTNGTLGSYTLPNGTNYLGRVYSGGTGDPAEACYRISGIDLGVNTSNNAWVTINRFDWIDRNNYVYPNSTSTIYGVYNMRYRVMGNQLRFIPIPAGNQQVRLWYAPILPALLADNDITTIGYSGWLRYVIVRAAIYALNKEESDVSVLMQELAFLKQRIEQSAISRDIGQAETISNTRKDSIYGPGWGSANGANGGW